MKLVCISDTHGQHNKLSLPKGDALIHAGDWSTRGSKGDTIDFLNWFQKQQHKLKLFIAGNHCWFPETYPKEFSKLKDKYAPDCVYLENKAIEMDGIKFFGSPITPTFYNWAFNRDRGEEINKYWEAIPTDTQVLITHGPPHSILDRVKMRGSPNKGLHVGCEDLMKHINHRLVNLKAHIFGHIHETYGTLLKDGKTFANASVLTEYYQYQNKPIEIEI